MKIIDLSPEHQSIYFVCLEDWSTEIKEAGNHKEIWYHRMKDKGLGVKLALDGDRVCGMIQYVPVEHSFIEGEDLYFIHCIWVHGHRQGIGNCQKQGLGKALLQAAEEDAKARQAKGMAAWGLVLPIWMKAAWFKKQGYRKVDRDGLAVLLWKPFSQDAQPPKWIKQKKKPAAGTGRVNVTAFKNGWCPVQNLVFERAKQAATEFGDRVEFEEIDTFDRPTYLEWGIADGLFVDGKQMRTGPPPAYEKIRKKIAKRVKKLG